MRLTILGSCGAWPALGQACSGYLVEHDGFRLLVDPGYAVTPLFDPTTLSAVFVSHGHPDHCADLNPILRARVLGGGRCPPLPVYALPGTVDRVLALDEPRMTAGSWEPVAVAPGTAVPIGPFTARGWLLPHHVPNLGIRLSTGDGRTLSYTGDSGPCPEIVELARDADVFLAEATYPERVPASDAAYLSSAAQSGTAADSAGVGRLVLTHLWPGTDPAGAIAAATAHFAGPTDVAHPGLVIDA